MAQPMNDLVLIQLHLQPNDLHVQLSDDVLKRVDPEDLPLKIQAEFLDKIGIDDPRKRQELGDVLSLGFLIRFYAGRPKMANDYETPTLSSCCHVRRGRLFHQWSRRLCVLSGSRILIYSNLEGNGQPEVLSLARAKVEEVHLKSRGRCVKITVSTTRKPVYTVYLAFDSVIDLNSWLSRCLKDPFSRGYLKDLSQFQSLRSLNLADNQLSCFPASLLQLTALTELILASNKISEIPAEISKLKNLQVLNLQNNCLSWLPSEMSELQTITCLDLSYNIFLCIPEVLVRLKSLEYWQLSGNGISSLPSDALLNCTLYCQRTEIKNIQLNGTSLTYLFASNNKLESMTVMPIPHNLKWFDVSYNLLTKIPEWLTELSQIEGIIASHNRLTVVPHRLFTCVSSLKQLTLNHNFIKVLPTQVENCFIEVLHLHHNKITHLPPEFLASTHKLKILNLAQNNLVTLPALNPFQDLNKVQQLVLSANRFTDAIFQIIVGYRRLRVLDLAYNHLRTIDNRWIEKLACLEEVNLSGNKLHSLPPAFATLPKLISLRAHSNKLTSLPDFSRCSTLKVLDVGSNQLETVDVRYFLSPHLKHLDLACNPRLHLDMTAFRQFESLESVGQKMGAACTLCRIVSRNSPSRTSPDPNNKQDIGSTEKSYRLVLANVGHSEAVLCRKGKPLVLSEKFLVSEQTLDSEEYCRIREAGAIITEDNEINGVTPCSRLLGCSFLHPAVIPDPQIRCIDMGEPDEFLVLASRGLWEKITYDEAVKRIRHIPNPILAAKHLQDMAQSYGYTENLSVLVVRFFFNPNFSLAPLGDLPSELTLSTKLKQAQSVVNIADESDSLSTDDEIRSEPQRDNS